MERKSSKTIQGSIVDSKKNIIFLVPDGVGVRNYLFSNIISEFKDKAHLHLWTTLTEKTAKEIETLHSVETSFYQFQLPKETFKVKLFREAATYARLLVNRRKLDNPAIMDYWSRNPKSIPLRIFYKLVKWMGFWVSAKYDWILVLEKKSRAAWPRKMMDRYIGLLKECKPNVIFVTHQRVASLNPICSAARELGIKVITCIYSWDNTAKASLAIEADEYLVWSSYMKTELLQLYPEIPEEVVITTGTPQFEFYLQEDRYMSKESMAALYGLDLQKKWICFSGDDEKTSPYDPQYLDDLATAIQSLPENLCPQIIFRRCPVDVSTRYDSVLEKWGERIVPIDPIWNTSTFNWGRVYPSTNDIDLLVNLARHCELVINLGSTMAHDFAIMGKPAFYIAYDPFVDKNWSTKTIYQFQHFKSMDGKDAVGWFYSRMEMADKLAKALKDPKSVAPDREQWLKLIVKHPLSNASKEIAKRLLA
ncbi:MAG TPA: hypothetical protein PLP62_12700 [Flavobacteriaceae bacterium]|nr:hypothetical protein [Flavobacteriaceae bacterium]